MPEIDDLVARFRAFLETAPPEGDGEAGRREPDLYALFTELAGLRNEVRLESRHLKAALDEFREAFRALDEARRSATAEAERCRARLDDERRAARRPLLLGLVDLYDRLRGPAGGTEAGRPSFWFRFCGREQRLLAAHEQGLALAARRVEELLAGHGVKPIPCLGQPFDPRAMRAVGTAARPETPDGVVIEEVRQGFAWEDGILRPAEVIVNRKERTDA